MARPIIQLVPALLPGLHYFHKGTFVHIKYWASSLPYAHDVLVVMLPMAEAVCVGFPRLASKGLSIQMVIGNLQKSKGLSM